MTNEDLTVQLLSKLGLKYDSIARKAWGGKSPILFGDLIHSIFVQGTIPKTAKALGVGEQTLNRTISDKFIPIFGNLTGGGDTWKLTFLDYLGLQNCSDCKNLLPFSEYHKDSSSRNGICRVCKTCRVVRNAENYKKECTKESHTRSYIKNKEAIKARNALYRAQIDLRVPTWSDRVEIALVFKGCPEGYHVDHIIPMRGELVCGLHVSENLQYLSEADNIRKSNSFDIEKYNNGEVWYELNSLPLKVHDRLDKYKIRKLQRAKDIIHCLNCGKEFKQAKYSQTYCSKSCSGKHLNPSTEIVAGFTREYIESVIWSMPFTKGSKIVGLSDNGLRKMANRLGCRMPPERFHTKSETFKEAERNKAGVAKLAETHET